jgi:hypothetical protein
MDVNNCQPVTIWNYDRGTLVEGEASIKRIRAIAESTLKFAPDGDKNVVYMPLTTE